MEDNTKPLYRFHVINEEEPSAQYPFQVKVNFSGDLAFINDLLQSSKRDRVLLTGRTAPFTMRLLFGTKYLFYFIFKGK